MRTVFCRIPVEKSSVRRSAKSSTETMAATRLHKGWAFGATASSSLSPPHSSASTWERPTHRSRSAGITEPIA